MNKRILAVLLALILTMGMLSACGSSGNNATEPGKQTETTPTSEVPQFIGNFAIPEGGYDGSEVTVTFYHTMGQNLRDVLDAYIAEFNKLYPNIHIEHSQVGGYDDVRDQISTEITVGNQPSMAYCYPDHVAMYNLADAVVILDDLISSRIEVARADGTTEFLGLTEEQVADFIEG